ncbi:hypothetical protein EVAR_12283_1 [Eumeta japonica]|uniref:Uncharacterized protein n=1 Tax=Eumeta variegata TaxID=151549 RepID=A0A4C1TU78_EUMVA|nr:hypothetical protein EVAR_12283_1 [Eumeta japonica]
MSHPGINPLCPLLVKSVALEPGEMTDVFSTKTDLNHSLRASESTSSDVVVALLAWIVNSSSTRTRS